MAKGYNPIYKKWRKVNDKAGTTYARREQEEIEEALGASRRTNEVGHNSR